MFELRYKLYGDHAILIEWPEKINTNILKDVLFFKEKILKSNVESLLEVISSYNSLLIVYELAIRNIYDCFETLKHIYYSNALKTNAITKLWRIPVCYDTAFGIDLDAISEEKKISKDEIIKMHSEAIYTVYFIGFLSGFLYLGGLNESLALARKQSPRLKVKKGAVAIGGNQTGVYPNESPGGWHIIGNSPIDFFNVKNSIPCFAKSGDRIQFYPVSLKVYHDIKVLVDAGVYQIESKDV